MITRFPFRYSNALPCNHQFNILADILKEEVLKPSRAFYLNRFVVV